MTATIQNMLIGKKIKNAYMEDLKDKGLDDEPYLFLEMEDGSKFQIKATYGGYTGNSEDEYPSFIILTKVAKES